MGFLQELAEQTEATASKCPVALMMRDMDPADLKDLEQALEDTTYTGVLIARVLQNRGINMTSRAVQNHRRKSCSCRS